MSAHAFSPSAVSVESDGSLVGEADTVKLGLVDCEIIDTEVGPGGMADMSVTIQTSGGDFRVAWTIEVWVGGVRNRVHAEQGPNRTIEHIFGVQVPIEQGVYDGIEVNILDPRPADYFNSG